MCVSVLGFSFSAPPHKEETQQSKGMLQRQFQCSKFSLAGVISWVGFKNRTLFLGSSWADLDVAHAAHHSFKMKPIVISYAALDRRVDYYSSWYKQPSRRGYQCTLQTLLVLSAGCISSLLSILFYSYSYLPKISWYAGEWHFSRMTAYVNKLLLSVNPFCQSGK